LRQNFLTRGRADRISNIFLLQGISGFREQSEESLLQHGVLQSVLRNETVLLELARGKHTVAVFIPPPQSLTVYGKIRGSRVSRLLSTDCYQQNDVQIEITWPLSVGHVYTFLQPTKPVRPVGLCRILFDTGILQYSGTNIIT